MAIPAEQTASHAKRRVKSSPKHVNVCEATLNRGPPILYKEVNSSKVIFLLWTYVLQCHSSVVSQVKTSRGMRVALTWGPGDSIYHLHNEHSF